MSSKVLIKIILFRRLLVALIVTRILILDQSLFVVRFDKAVRWCFRPITKIREIVSKR